MVVVNKITILNPVCSPASDAQRKIRSGDAESEWQIFSPLAIVK